MVGFLGQGTSPSQGRNLTHTQNKQNQISKPLVGFEPTILMFERAKIFPALDRVVTVIGLSYSILRSMVFTTLSQLKTRENFDGHFRIFALSPKNFCCYINPEFH
jgi:hypothetical protein